MKKRFLILMIASVFMMAAEMMNTVDLTVINKSEVDIGLMLTSLTDDDRWYYFKIPNGHPEEQSNDDDGWYSERHFEIVRDIYASTAYFMEAYDPVYKYPYCGNKTIGSRLVATHSIKLVYKPCKTFSWRPGSYREMRYIRVKKKYPR